MTKSILRSRYRSQEQSDKKTSKKVTFLRSPLYFEYYEPQQRNHLLEDRRYMEQFYSLLEILSKSTSSSTEDEEEERKSEHLLCNSSDNGNYSGSFDSLKVCTSGSFSNGDDDDDDDETDHNDANDNEDNAVRDTSITDLDSGSISVMFFEFSDIVLHSLQNSLNQIENVATNYFLQPINQVHQQHQKTLQKPSLIEYFIKCTRNNNNISKTDNENDEQEQQHENRDSASLVIASEVPRYVYYSEHKVIDHRPPITKKSQRRRNQDSVINNHQQVGHRRKKEHYFPTRSDDQNSSGNNDLVEMQLDDPQQILLDISRLSRGTSSSTSSQKTKTMHCIGKDNKTFSELLKNDDPRHTKTCQKNLETSTNNASVSAFKTRSVKEDKKERAISMTDKKFTKKRMQIRLFWMKGRNKE